MPVVLKRPLAWLPIAFALGALLIILVSFAAFGVPHHSSDEGAAAHLFQIWFVLETFMIGLFLVRWLRTNPKQVLLIFIAQIAAVLTACAPIFYYHL